MQLAAARTRLKRVLKSKYFHVLIIALLILDMCILFTEHILLIYQLHLLETTCKHYSINEPSEDHIAEEETIKVFELVFRYLTLAIVAIFMLELLLKLYAYGLHLFSKIWDSIDALVILAAFFGEIFLAGLAEQYVTLLLPLRILRLIRYTHVIAEIEGEEVISFRNSHTTSQ